MEKKTTKAAIPERFVKAALQEHFVEAVPWDGSSFKEEEAKRRKEQGRGPHPEDDPVEAAYDNMVEATAMYLEELAMSGVGKNYEETNPADFTRPWVEDRLNDANGTRDFYQDVFEDLQKSLAYRLKVENYAQHNLKFFIFQRIARRDSIESIPFSDTDHWAHELDGLISPEDYHMMCHDVAGRMSQIWDEDYAKPAGA